MAMLAINNHEATSTGISPFFATYGYHIDLLNTLTDVEEPLRIEGHSPVAKGEAFVTRLKQATESAQAAMASVQEQQEEYTNQARQPAEQFRVGDKVWLSLKYIKTNRPSKKLDWRNAKYEVIGVIGSHSYRLNTPRGFIRSSTSRC